MLKRFADLYDWMKARSYVDALFNWLFRLVLVGAMCGTGWSINGGITSIVIMVLSVVLWVPLAMQSIDGSAYLFKKLHLFNSFSARFKYFCSGMLGLAVALAIVASVFRVTIGLVFIDL